MEVVEFGSLPRGNEFDRNLYLSFYDFQLKA